MRESTAKAAKDFPGMLGGAFGAIPKVAGELLNKAKSAVYGWKTRRNPEISADEIIELAAIDTALLNDGGRGVDLTPTPEQEANLRRLQQAIVEPLKEYGEPTSGFRNKELQDKMKEEGYDVADKFVPLRWQGS